MADDEGIGWFGDMARTLAHSTPDHDLRDRIERALMRAYQMGFDHGAQVLRDPDGCVSSTL